MTQSAMLPFKITLKSPGEVFFRVDSFEIYWYGVMIALGFVVALGATLWAARREKIDPERVLNLSALLLIGGILCSRLYFVICDWKYFASHPAEIFLLRHGGLSIHGVIIGCFLILLAYTWLKKLSLLKYSDLFASTLPLGQAIGRWGNFFNAEAFGAPTNLPLSVYIPPEARPIQYLSYEHFHPTFLYESIWNFLVFAVLFFVLRHKFGTGSGVITCSYLVLYSFGRFFIEILRVDSISNVAGLPVAQFISVILFSVGLFGLGLIYVLRRRAGKGVDFSDNQH